MIIEARRSSQQDDGKCPSIKGVGNHHQAGHPPVERIFQSVGEKVTKAVDEIIFQFTPRTLQPVPFCAGNCSGKKSFGEMELNRSEVLFFGDNKKPPKKKPNKRPDGIGTYSIPNEKARQTVRENGGQPVHKRRKRRFWILPW